MAAMVGADSVESPIITSYANTPYNYSGIDFLAVQELINEAGGIAVPFLQNLGEVKNPSAKSNPSSAPIFAVPNYVLEKSLGVSLPAADCEDLSVIVGQQLGVPAGAPKDQRSSGNSCADNIDEAGAGPCRGHRFARTNRRMRLPGPAHDGRHRVGAGRKRAGATAEDRGRPRTFVPRSLVRAFQKEYQQFWDGSVKPPEMNLILDLLLAGGIALSSMQTSEILRRRKNIAMLLSQGVPKKYISRPTRLQRRRTQLSQYPWLSQLRPFLPRLTTPPNSVYRRPSILLRSVRDMPRSQRLHSRHQLWAAE